MSNDWYAEPPQDRPREGARPTPRCNPDDGNLGVDDLEIAPDVPPHSVTSGAIGQAWERVKQQPVETLLLSFVSLLFGNSGGSCNVPSPGTFGSGESDAGNGESSGSEYDFDTIWHGVTDIGVSIGDFLSVGEPSSQVGGLLGISAGEAGVMAGVALVVVFVVVILVVLSGVVEAFSNVYWLRLIRDQSDSLGDTDRAFTFLIPLVLTSILQQLAIFGGFLLLIIPGIMAALGFHFATFVVVDKNIGYINALKASWRITDGYKAELFGLLLLLALLNFAGVLACCVGMIVTNAIGMGAIAIVYDRLTVRGNAYLEPDEDIATVFE